METLSSKQLVLIDDLKDDIQYYKEELNKEIRFSKISIGVGIVIAILVGGFIMFNPEIMQKLQDLYAHMDMITGLVGEVLPVTFISKSFNTSKDQKKKLNGLRIFEKTIKHMEFNIIPNSPQDILSVENDLAIYINT